MEAVAKISKPASLLERGRFSINLVSNLGQLGLSMAVGVWYVPYLIHHLGQAAYGLIPLTSVLTSYMGLITLGLDTTVARYLILALEREDHRQANLIFNISFWSNVALAAVLALPAAAMVVFAERIVRIPAGYETATRWLFAGTAAAFLLNQVKTPFSVSAFCRNRLDLKNLAAVAEILTKVGVIVALFSLASARIEYVGAAILASTVVATLIVIYQWRVLTPTLHISPRQFEWAMLRNLTSTGGWVIVSQLGVMLYTNIDLVVANRLFGAEVGGDYAAVLQIPFLLRSLSTAVGGIFSPTMYKLYARGDTGELVRYLRRAMRFLGLVMALPIGLICGFSEPLLRLWLGPSFSPFAPLLVVMTVYMCVTVALYPLNAIPLAANRVKAQGLVTVAIGIGNIGLAVFLARSWGWGLYGLAAAGAIAMIARYVVFTPLYSARILKQRLWTFYENLLPVLAVTAAIIGLSRLVIMLNPVGSWFELGLGAAGVSLAAVAGVLAFLAPGERRALREMVPWPRRG
jgi:membrane protein EpsK